MLPVIAMRSTARKSWTGTTFLKNTCEEQHVDHRKHRFGFIFYSYPANPFTTRADVCFWTTRHALHLATLRIAFWRLGQKPKKQIENQRLNPLNKA
jgi:hypothetical protein